MVDIANMSPRRPYLFRAMYDWILDNELTPYIVVNTTVYGVLVPDEFIQNNQIVLNIAPQSVGQYSINNQQLEFNARFGGNPHHIVVPMAAIEAIYARENGAGLAFEVEPQYQKRQEEPKKTTSPFKVVK
ncbi:ClpXP protease specificity-enhancing factor [Orbus sasakiae]|uniref:ClpXP protease specificity-enhancing factor n=1 Tax=Orbus sasakiae TaxID=1078475 RepID=A0ABP9N5W6_9GAMM